MQIISQQKSPPEHTTDYIAEFQDALRMVQAWYKSQPANDIMAGQIENWTQTCDLLTENQYFNEQHRWRVPTFQPWYHFDTHLCLQRYFFIRLRLEPNKRNELEKQRESARKMFITWEEVCFNVFQRSSTPIPKCLWYYKIKYIQRNESKKWKSFFHDTPFQTWGYAKESDEREKRNNTRETNHGRKPPTHPSQPKEPSNKNNPNTQN
jgi:hypothetical protein